MTLSPLDKATAWHRLSLEELTAFVALDEAPNHIIARAEIERRVAQSQIDAARYMKWSVIAIAITSGITAVMAIIDHLWPSH